MSQFNLENVTAFDYKGSSSKVSKVTGYLSL